MIINFFKKLYSLFLIILFLMIVAAGIKFDLYPLWLKIKPIYLASNTFSQRYAEYNDDIKNAHKLQSQLIESQQKFSILVQPIPQEKNFQNFLNTLADEAKQQALNITEMNLKTPISKEFYKIIPVEFTFSGSYEHFLNFLNSLQSQKYFVSADSWTLTREMPPMTTVLKPENSPDNLTINITLEFVVLK
jgi:Tfp pilus assembly protein PilO